MLRRKRNSANGIKISLPDRKGFDGAGGGRSRKNGITEKAAISTMSMARETGTPKKKGLFPTKNSASARRGGDEKFSNQPIPAKRRKNGGWEQEEN